MITIGITSRIDTFDSQKREYVNLPYLEKLKNLDISYVFINLQNFKILSNLCDGFIITGGDDIDPRYYNEENFGYSKNISSEADSLDSLVVNHSLKHSLPLLGICRGLQSINVFCGGSLNQDIGETHTHIINKHKINIFNNKLINFNDHVLVNSFHHQSIKSLAKDFLVFAKHSDGTIEGIIHKDLPIIGVQWHPELLENDFIFKAFKDIITQKKNDFLNNHSLYAY